MMHILSFVGEGFPLNPELKLPSACVFGGFNFTSEACVGPASQTARQSVKSMTDTNVKWIVRDR